MMAHLISLEHRGRTIFVEAELGPHEVTPIAAVTQIRKLEDVLGAVSDIVVTCAAEVSRALNSLAAEAMRPATAVLEVGVKFTGSGDIFVVKAAAGAALKITLTWQIGDDRPPAPAKTSP